MFAFTRAGAAHGCAAVIRVGFVIAVTAVISAGAPRGAGAQNRPLDSATAHRLLIQITAALDSTPTLTLQPQFTDFLGATRSNWGMPPYNLWPYFLRLPRMQYAISMHLQRGEMYSALVKADSIGRTYDARVFLFTIEDSSEAKLRLYVDGVRQFLTERPEAPNHDELERHIMRLRARYEFDSVLAEADTITDSRRRTIHKVELATLALRQRLPSSDSLLTAVTAELNQHIPDTRLRSGLLENLWHFCNPEVSERCDEIGFTPTPKIPAFHSSYGGLLAERNWRLFGIMVDSLTQYLTPSQVGAVLLRSANYARTECSARDAICGADVDRSIDSWLKQMKEWVSGTTNIALRDTLRTQAAVLLAGRDTRRALQLIAASRDTMLNQVAYGELTRLLLSVDAPNAWYAFQRSGKWGAVWSTEFAMQFRMRGDTANERRALERMDPTTRLRFELGWARHLFNGGQTTLARNHALDALGLWDPAVDPIMTWPGQFDVFQQLGIYRQLVQWAESRPTATARSAAILAVVGSVIDTTTKRAQ